jgi:hypothetical protein
MANLELETFDQIRRYTQLLTGNRIDQARAGELINLKLKEYTRSHTWSWMKGDTVLPIVAPKVTGTITLNADPTKIDGTGTSFASADIGSYLRVSLDVPFFQITNVMGQQLTIETPYPGAAFVNKGYTLFRHIYSLPTDFRKFISPSYWDRLREVTQQEIDQLDPLRTTQQQTPELYAYHGPDRNNNMQVEIWPVPTVATIIRYTYLKTIPQFRPIDGALTVPLRGDVVAMGAAAEAFYTLAADKENVQHSAMLLQLGDRWTVKEKEALDDALRADQYLVGLPEAVGQYQPSINVGADYMINHDFDW